jgi:alkanesulfonate monooxygenase SsuD/methylene tetrahydromethanopterin reductase-like flavin-dependent oxidoreductase (luciferase family)
VRDDAPKSFEGRFYQLREGASLLPRPQRPGGPRIMIGGNGPKRTLPLAARYANIWNGVSLTLETFVERSALLDSLLEQEGRARSSVKRTLMVPVHFGRDSAELDQQLAWRHQRPELAGQSLDDVVEHMRARGAVVGGPHDIARYLHACDGSRVEEVFLQWLALDDIDRLRGLASAIGEWLTPEG